ncbi:MAG: type II toxin-antitoxin system VapC family toxin [Deltaproteobacteria bacterium]|nr:type II toxin-antitoxin system VapC family toxin [Deltaproteobacteria bacterium]
MKEIFLDTSAYSAFKRGTAKVMEAIREADQVFLNAIVIGELLSGFSGGKFNEPNRQELKEFLSFPYVTILPLSEETAERYAFIYSDLKAHGTPIPTNDLWIAASVMEKGAALLTFDQHFSKVHQIQTLLIPMIPT